MNCDTNPELLYHYCSNSAFQSIISNRAVWLSSLSLSNDTMEGRWLRTLFEQECSENGINNAHVPEIMQNFDQIVEMTDALGLCLSEAGDLLSQWRGYSEDASGVSIGFKKAYFEEKSATSVDEVAPGYSLRKVCYGNLPDGGSTRTVLESLKRSSDEGIWDSIGLVNMPRDDDEWQEWRNRRIAAGLPMLSLFFDLFVVKNPAFQEEREWRVISFSFRDTEEPVQYRARHNALVPYREYSLGNPGSAIGRVILGPKNGSREDDVKRFLRSAGFGDVEVIRSEASYR